MPQIECEEELLDAIFRPLDSCHMPGVGIGIAINGRPVYRKAFGLQDVEKALALSTSTRMRIGSVSKHMCALGWMLLCEDGRAELDEPITRYLPELEHASGVTARHLMGNVSGLRDVYDVVWQFSGLDRDVTSEQLFNQYRTLSSRSAEPNEHFIYNNGGWLILAAAVERITGQAFEDVLRERIFDPLGMYDTMLRRSDRNFVPNSATLHVAHIDNAYEKWYDNDAIHVEARPRHLVRTSLGTDLSAAGGIVSTVDDMLRWLAHMDRPTVGSGATWDLMRSSQSLNNGFSTGYGFGLINGTFRGIPISYHTGGVLGGNCQMLKVPQFGIDIVAILNRSDVFGSVLADQVLELLLKLAPVQEAPVRLALQGSFHSPVTGRAIQLIQRGERGFAIVDGAEMPVAIDQTGLITANGRMFGWADNAVQMREDGGELELSFYGHPDHLVRLGEGARATDWTLSGRYECPEAGARVVISDDGSRRTFHTEGPFGTSEFQLDCLGDRVWRASPIVGPFPPGGTLEFDCDGRGFTFSSFRNWLLRFHRCEA